MAECMYCGDETGTEREECVPCSDAAEGGIPD